MTDHPSTDTDTNTSTDDHGSPSVDRSFATLAPTVRTIAFDAVPPRDRSLPVALCLNAGALAAAIDADDARAIDPRTDDRLEPVTNAVALLEGYVRIRADLLADRGDDADRRDAAVLASDFLHAAAYEPIAAASIPERRSLELYRTLAAGSSSLAARFARSAGEQAAYGTGEPDGNGTGGTDRPDATLAATAAALGAAATGASSDARTALETYARSLSAALRTRTGALPENASAEPRDAAVRVLFGRADAGNDGIEPEPPARGGTDAVDVDDRAPSSATAATEPAAASSSVAAVEHNLERAREALSTLEDLAASTADRAPIGRLERATRIPFRHEE